MHKTSLLLSVAAVTLSFATASFADDGEIKAKAESYTKSEVAKWVEVIDPDGISTRFGVVMCSV